MVKTKALISCAVTAQLICVFVFAYANCAHYLQILWYLWGNLYFAVVVVFFWMIIGMIELIINPIVVPALIIIW